MPETKHVRANFDPEARVWWAESDDITGLVSEAPTLDALMDRVLAVAGELMAANGEASGEICLEFTATRPVQMA
ncbi:MAG TPA: DUF1902 domain-containing protein [Acetobacteraceae bacterium]|jgi:hypothetical protein|nr:DUF1902 domain-containing protein [Acetobacteraceae bacterium]